MELYVSLSFKERSNDLNNEIVVTEHQLLPAEAETLVVVIPGSQI